MATQKGLEPSTSGVTGRHSNQLSHWAICGGNNRDRTCDPLLVRQMLSQLSYAPTCLHSTIIVYTISQNLSILLYINHFTTLFSAISSLSTLLSYKIFLKLSTANIVCIHVYFTYAPQLSSLLYFSTLCNM